MQHFLPPGTSNTANFRVLFRFILASLKNYRALNSSLNCGEECQESKFWVFRNLDIWNSENSVDFKNQIAHLLSFELTALI